MYAHFNDAARLALRLAKIEAERAGRACIDTEHLLLALLDLKHCVAARVLKSNDIDQFSVCGALAKYATLTDEEPGGRQTLTSGCQRAIDFAGGAAERLGHARVGTGHLLLGLLEEAQGLAYHALCAAGIVRVGYNLSRVAERVVAVMKERETREAG